MKGPTHSAFARILARLVTYHGFAPRAHDLLLADVDLFARSMALPDNAIEVAIRMPSGELATEILGNTTEPLCHFEPGYLWSKDPTLSIGGALVDAAAHLCGATVELRTDGVRPPAVPMDEESPFVRALKAQPHRTITDFRFPSASEMAGYYTRAAHAWLNAGNVPGCIECMAYAAHMEQDCCITYHGQSALLAGHSDREVRLQEHFAADFGDGSSIDSDRFDELVKAARREMLAVQDCRTVEDLCIRCAGWARSKWPDLGAFAESDWNVSLAVCVRALAASVRGLELMTEESR